MVEDYLSDREQEEALLAWWRENWSWILSGILLGMALLGGWRYWEYRKVDGSEHAAKVFQDLESAAAANDAARVEPLVKELQDKYGSTPYADQAKLLQAKMQFDAGKLDQAAASLQAVAEHSKDENLAQVARLRWARVVLEQAKYDEALKLLDPAKAGAFAAQTHEIRGDVLLAKGDADGARSEYQTALDAPEGQRSAGRELLQLKLQDLGQASGQSSAQNPGQGSGQDLGQDSGKASP